MSHPRYRSLFWPILLISVGLIWFLANINVIPNFNPLVLLNLWPLLLIALGLDLIIGRRSPVFGLLIGLATVAAAVAIVVAVPNLGGGQYSIERFTEPVGNAVSASVEVDGASQPAEVHALSDSANLFDAQIGHFGKMNFEVSGGSQKTISLRRASENGNFTLNFGFTAVDLRWDIGLSPSVPLALKFEGASGSTRLNLAGLQLQSLAVDSGSGSFDIDLPVGEKAYAVNYNGGSGSLNLTLPANTDLTVKLSGGSGSLNMNLPANAAVRLEVKDNGSGSINVPAALLRLSGKSNEDQGTWETSGFASAAHKITIIVQVFGSGSLNLR